MTLDELAFHQQKMADAGYSAEAVAALGAWAAEWRGLRTAERRARRIAHELLAAVEEALFPTEKMNEASTPAPISPVEASTGIAPAHGPARTMMLALEGLRRAPLTPSEVMVGQAILSFCSDASGGCFPGLERLAMRAGVTKRTARRAVARLDLPRTRTRPATAGARTEKPGLGLIVVERHAGLRHSNMYRPQWSRLVALAASGQMNEASTAARRPHSTGEPSAGGPQSRDRIQSGSVGGKQRARPDPRQPQFKLPIPGGRQVAEQAAQRRVMDDIERAARAQPGFNVSGLSRADWTDVYAAEAADHGQGIELIRARLATGPPGLERSG